MGSVFIEKNSLFGIPLHGTKLIIILHRPMFEKEKRNQNGKKAV